MEISCQVETLGGTITTTAESRSVYLDPGCIWCNYETEATPFATDSVIIN